jgi:immunity protein, SdpI family
MSRLGRYRLALTFLAAAFATSAALYRSLPAVIPTHWNAQGVVDGWMPKAQGAFFGPALASVIIAGLILFEPWLPAAGAEAGSTARILPTIVAAVAGLLFYVNLLVLMAGMGWHLDMPSHLAIGVGILLIVLGNTFGKVTRNGMIGIRTPWTLADEEVWARTHRIAGWLFVMAGVVTAIAGFMGLRLVPGLIAIGAAAALSAAYSYVLWRRLN